MCIRQRDSRKGAGPTNTATAQGSVDAAPPRALKQFRPADSYSAALTMDVGTLEPSRGALEAACHRLRTGAIQRR
jgi:hypothetical protein